MKKTASLLLAFVLLWMMIPAMAEGKAFTIADVNSEATLEDFSGEYVCTFISFGDTVLPATLEVMQTQEIPTLKIAEGKATFTGIAEMGTDPVALIFADGELSFVPEKDVTVFTLRLLMDGVVSMTFDVIEAAPVFYFTPAEAEAPLPDWHKALYCCLIERGHRTLPGETAL